MEKIGNITLYNADCMDIMKSMSDSCIDLAIVDPPYGIGKDWKKRNKGHKFKETSYTNSTIPDAKYFTELKRISKNFIIWGYNYYADILGSTNYLIVWDKCSNNNQVFKYSKVEIACTSICIPANIVHVPWDGYRMGNETGIKKIHPHQKPVLLYRWLLKNYAKKGWTIFDSHFGSGSLGIAAQEENFELIAVEIDPEIYETAKMRNKVHRRQLNLF